MINTNIEWCDSTINPVTGCMGCELWGPNVRRCYAGNLHEKRLAKSIPALYAPSFQEIRLASGRMMQAAKWSDLRGKDRSDKRWLNGKPRTIFVGDMGDFCSKSVPDEYIIDEIIGAVKSPPGSRHFWFLLTKQIRRLAEISERIGGLPDNCMAMTTVTDQRTADTRIPDLVRTICRWRGISAEPLWGSVNLYLNKKERPYRDRRWEFPRHQLLDWVITGGESEQDSGIEPKPSHPDWFRKLRDDCKDCKAGGIPFFLKQIGYWTLRYASNGDIPFERCKVYTGDGAAPVTLAPVGKKRAGRLLDGQEHNGFPQLVISTNHTRRSK